MERGRGGRGKRGRKGKPGQGPPQQQEFQQPQPQDFQQDFQGGAMSPMGSMGPGMVPPGMQGPMRFPGMPNPNAMMGPMGMMPQVAMMDMGPGTMIDMSQPPMMDASGAMGFRGPNPMGPGFPMGQMSSLVPGGFSMNPEGMGPGPSMPPGGPQGMFMPQGPPGAGGGGGMGVPMPHMGMPPPPAPPRGPPGGDMRPGGPPGGGGPRPRLPGAAAKHVAANDYCQHFVDTGLRPQNFLRDSVLDDRYAEYPKLKRLVEGKNEQVENTRTPAYGLRADLLKLKLSKEVFGTKFDVILIDPPWEEYVRRAPGFVSNPEVWTWEQIMALDIDSIADTPSFLFLWCGGGAEGLEAGRHCLRRWNFRRSEDICWIKTNREHPGRKYLSASNQDAKSCLVRTKEHCLLGIRGSVKRGPDSHLLHTNCDTDVIVSEEPPLGSTEKPEELYQIIERFCNGKRRLELFAEDHNMRPGWVSVGKHITTNNFRPQTYIRHFTYPDGTPYTENRSNYVPPDAPTLVPTTAEIEELRPKSPPRRH